MSWLYQWKDYSKLYQLSIKRLDSQEDYYKFEVFQGRLLVRYLHKHHSFSGGFSLLDLGCGMGGYTAAFQEAGLNSVGLDLSFQYKGVHVPKIAADALQTPFAGHVFDIVICASLIEHVSSPNELLNEIIRIVKPGGIIYISFPPFYSINGGHQFAPFHLFGERFALWAFSKRKKNRLKGWVRERMNLDGQSYQEAFGKWGLYRMTIRKIRKLVRRDDLRLLDISTKLIPINFARIPLLGEFLTWHVQILLRRR
jgi:SAM-dependent methyltransferase